MSRKVCIVTGSRAEYGLLRPVMAGIRASEGLELQTLVTGTHLSARFGMTYTEIERDGFHIDRKVDIDLESDTPAGIARSMGLALSGVGEALASLQPDVMLVLGDRFEILSAAAAALVARIPTAHLHGGETTEGAFDESIRHAITKMSHLHFVAADEYRQRVIQLGEDPERVFMVGGLGVDVIRKAALLGRAELEAAIGFRFGRRNLLITFHPETLESEPAGHQVAELLAALARLEDTHLIFTMPNADPGNHAIGDAVEAFAASRPNVRVYASLGIDRYLSCLQFVDGVVGNSSSGLTEVPSFRKATINIGGRQRGRLKASSVIDCAAERGAISAAIDQLYSETFQARLPDTTNPYGDGGASDRIVGVLKNYPLSSILRKTFHDAAC